MSFYEKALKTAIGSGSDRKIYLLPYSGNLTEARLNELAMRLYDELGQSDPTRFTPLWAKEWLKNEWYCGREKDVLVQENQYGNIDMSGPGWSAGNYPKNEVVILEQKYHGRI